MTRPARALLPPLAFLFPWLAMLGLGGAGSGFDRAVYLAFYAGGQPGLASAARIATFLGSAAALIPLSLAAALYLLLSGRKRASLLLLLVTLGGRLLVSLQKTLIARPRPALEEHLVTVQSMSFPSGHAANSMIVFLAIALLLPRRPRAAHLISALFLSLLIGSSRVILGVHWPSDVVGGWAFGLAWTLGLVALTRPKTPPV